MSTTNAKVMLRFRPLSMAEMSSPGGCRSVIQSIDDTTVQLCGNDKGEKSYTFDSVFPTSASQALVYERIGRPIIEGFLKGFNGCLMAYGQTGSGKTFSMFGPDDLLDILANNGSAVELSEEEGRELEEAAGIVPRALQDLFQLIETETPAPGQLPMEYQLQASCVEIYRECIKDLLDPRPDKCDLKVVSGAGGGPEVKGLTQRTIQSSAELIGAMQEGMSARRTAATAMNERSSRSHLIFMLHLTRSDPNAGTLTHSVLHLCDLAGSEVAHKTGVSGTALKEAGSINSSLTTLGLVINKLTDPASTHIPYRSSPLTRLLENALGGNSNTALLIAASPSPDNYAETLSTLRFGSAAKRIEQRATVVVERSLEELKKHCGRLEAEAAATGAALRLLREAVEGGLVAHTALAKGVDVLGGILSAAGSGSGGGGGGSGGGSKGGVAAASPQVSPRAAVPVSGSGEVVQKGEESSSDDDDEEEENSEGGSSSRSSRLQEERVSLLKKMQLALVMEKASREALAAKEKELGELQEEVARLSAATAAKAEGGGGGEEEEGRASQLARQLEDRDIYIRALEARLSSGAVSPGTHSVVRGRLVGGAGEGGAGGGGGGGGGGAATAAAAAAAAMAAAASPKKSSFLGSLITGIRRLPSLLTSPRTPKPSLAASAAAAASASASGAPSTPLPSSASSGSAAEAFVASAPPAPLAPNPQALKFFALCEQGQLEAVQALLASDAAAGHTHPASPTTPLLQAADRSGRSAVLYAARGGAQAVLAALAAAGAELGVRDKDARSALAYAARRGHTGVAEWLLGAGLPAAQSDVHGLTPLHQAVLAKCPGMALLLLRAGADVGAKDSNGFTPFRLAQRFHAADSAESSELLAGLQAFLGELPEEERRRAGMGEGGRQRAESGSGSGSGSGSSSGEGAAGAGAAQGSGGQGVRQPEQVEVE